MPRQYGLGHWKAPDPRSQNYLYRATVRRRSVLHAADGPILDQDGVGACGGFFDADILNTAKFYRSRRRPLHRIGYLGDEAGFNFYSAATLLDEWPDEKWPPDDVGTSMTGCAKALQKAGYIDRYEWADDFPMFLAALERQPVGLGTLWTSGMDDPDSKFLIRPTGDLEGGHAFMAFGVNYTSQRIKCRNHWTDGWGDDGDFYVSFADMEWLISQGGEVVVPIPVG